MFDFKREINNSHSVKVLGETEHSLLPQIHSIRAVLNENKTKKGHSINHDI